MNDVLRSTFTEQLNDFLLEIPVLLFVVLELKMRMHGSIGGKNVSENVAIQESRVYATIHFLLQLIKF